MLLCAGVEASEGMLHKVTKIFNVMRQRVAAGAGPAVQRSHRSYRVPLMQKACTALQALPDQQVKPVQHTQPERGGEVGGGAGAGRGTVAGQGVGWMDAVHLICILHAPPGKASVSEKRELLAFGCAAPQGTLPDILQYIAGRVDWHDDLTWGISHTNTSRGPAWHTEIQKAVTRSPAIVHTGEKRGRAFVYRYDPTLDRARAPRKASRWGLAGVPLNAGPAHAPAR